MTAATSTFEVGTRRDMKVDGQRVAVFEPGAGEPCLLIHGYPQTHWCWHKVAPGLARTHRVIMPDWFGCGASEQTFESRPTWEHEQDRIRKLIEALGTGPVNLIVHDYGGFIGLGFAARNPQLVRRLAVINSRAQGYFAAYPWTVFNTFCAIARAPFGEKLFGLLPLHTMHRQSLKQEVRKGVFSKEELEHYIGWMRTWSGRRWLGHVYRYFQGTRRKSLRDEARTLKMPSAVIWGDRDPFSRFWIGEELASLMPASKLTRIRGAGHFTPEERPDEVLAALTELLGRQALQDHAPPNS